MTKKEFIEINFLRDADNTIRASIRGFKTYLVETSKFIEDNLEIESKGDSLGKFLYNSQLLTYYAFFETWLKKMCEYHYKLGLNDIGVNDLSGRNYIEKSKRYFKKVAGFQLEDLEQEWERIQIIQQVRNLIAHNNSSIIKNSKLKIKEQPQFLLIKNEKLIKLDLSTGDFFIQDSSYLLEVLDLFQSYLSKIIHKIDKPKVVFKSSEYPFDMGHWGLEKVLSLIECTLSGVEELQNSKVRTDKYRYSDCIENSIQIYNSMYWNLTKLLSLFSGSNWSTKDVAMIKEDGRRGLKQLKLKYRIQNKNSLLRD